MAPRAWSLALTRDATEKVNRCSGKPVRVVVPTVSQAFQRLPMNTRRWIVARWVALPPLWPGSSAMIRPLSGRLAAVEAVTAPCAIVCAVVAVRAGAGAPHGATDITAARRGDATERQRPVTGFRSFGCGVADEATRSPLPRAPGRRGSA